MNNNFREKVKKMENTKQHFSIRKFNVGVVSVLLGLSFVGLSNSQKANAAVNPLDRNPQLQEANKQESVSQQKVVRLGNNENNGSVVSKQQEIKDNEATSNTDTLLNQSSNKVPVAQADVNQLKKDGVLYDNATAQNQIIIYTEPSAGLEPVNQKKGQYKFSDGMKVVGRVFSGYYKKDDSVYTDHTANNFEKSRDELVEKDTTGNGKLTLDLGQISPDYSNYEFDLDFSKQLDATRTAEFQKGSNNDQVVFDYQTVMNNAEKAPFLKNTTYQLFIKLKNQPTLQVKKLHEHSNETLLNWFSNGEGTQHDTYLGTSVVDDYSMGVGTYVNHDLRMAHPGIPIDAEATKYSLNLNQENNAGWKFEINGTNDATFGPNGFMPANNEHNQAVFDFEKLPSESLSINRGYLDPGMGSTTNNAIPEANPVSGYTNPNKIPVFVELGNGNKITEILSLEGKPGETIQIKDKTTLPEGAIFEPTGPQLPATYTFSKNGDNYNRKSAIFATTIRTSNVAYLTNNPALTSAANLEKNNAKVLDPEFQWNSTWAKNIQDYLKVHPIKKTVKESIYINGKLYKEVKQDLNRTITFEKTYGVNAIYKDPENPTIARSFGPWKNNEWQTVNDFAIQDIQLPKNVTNVKWDKGDLKDGKLSGVSLFNNNGDPSNVVVNISYDLAPNKGEEGNKPSTPSTPNKGEEGNKPSTPSTLNKGEEGNKPSTPSTPNKGEEGNELATPSTPNKGEEGNKVITDTKALATLTDNDVKSVNNNNQYGKAADVKSVNEEKQVDKLPQTGKHASTLPKVLGLAFVATGTLFGLLTDKKKKRNQY